MYVTQDQRDNGSPQPGASSVRAAPQASVTRSWQGAQADAAFLKRNPLRNLGDRQHLRLLPDAQPPCTLSAFAWLVDPAEAEDLTQEAFCSCLEIHTFVANRVLSCCTVTANIVLMRFRKKRLRSLA